MGVVRRVESELCKLPKRCAIYHEYELTTTTALGCPPAETAEVRTLRLVSSFTLIPILISCLGLFGLATFTTEQRRKEIGVSKVLGAFVSSVVTLLSGDFLKLVLAATVIASPLAWYAMDRWLQGFAYKTAIDCWLFALAGTLVILVALVTVSFQSVKAALMNPVKALQTE